MVMEADSLEAANALLLFSNSPYTPLVHSLPESLLSKVPPLKLELEVNSEEKKPEDDGQFRLLVAEMEKVAPTRTATILPRPRAVRGNRRSNSVVSPRNRINSFEDDDEDYDFVPKSRKKGEGRKRSCSMSQVANKRPRVTSLDTVSTEPCNDSVAKMLDSHARVGRCGKYTVEQRRELIMKFLTKRKNRVWTKRIKYPVRKKFADSRLRVKGRFVSKDDEDSLRNMLFLLM